jgi:hypothetical protein
VWRVTTPDKPRTSLSDFGNAIACHGLYDLMDDPDTHPDTIARLCGNCEARTACADYAKQHRRKVYGWWAGVWHEFSPPRKKAA